MPRAAESASLHVLMGNPNNKTKKEIYSRKKNEEKLKVGNDSIEPPEWLIGAAQRNFHRIRDVLKETELLTNADVDLLVVYSITIADLQDIELKIKTVGRYDMDGLDNLKVNGLMKEKRNIINQLLKLQNELALTPRARASLAIVLGGASADDAEEDDEFD